MDKIQRMSRRFRWFFMFVFVAMPVFCALVWANAEVFLEAEMSDFLGVEMMAAENVKNLTVWGKVLGFLSCMVSIVFAMAAMRYLAALFGEFERGELFTDVTVGLVSRTGWMFIFCEIANPFSQALASLSLTMNNPPGEHMVTLGLSDADIAGVVLGLGLIFAAKVLDEARVLKENDALTI